MMNSKRLIMLSLCSLAFSQLGFSVAAYAKDEKPVTNAADEYNLKFEKNARARRAENSAFRDLRLGVSGPVLITDDGTFLGASFFGLTEVSPNVLVGAETGFYFWSKSSSYGNASASQWLIPVLGTALYQFDNTGSSFSPYVGGNLGFTVTHASLSSGSRSLTGTEALFTFYVRGGAIFGEKQNYIADMRLGAIDGTLVLIPSIGYIF